MDVMELTKRLTDTGLYNEVKIYTNDGRTNLILTDIYEDKQGDKYVTVVEFE